MDYEQVKTINFFDLNSSIKP